MAKGDHLGEFEQVVMLAAARLGADAHVAAIQREIEQTTGRAVSRASIHVTLSRIERKRYVTSAAAVAPAVEGGRARKIYRLTLQGIFELQSIRLAYGRLWSGIPFDPLKGGAA